VTIRLSFGTAGIRAAMGPGLDQLNVLTVGGVAHAICAHLRESFPDACERGLCVGFDGRTDSDVFAREVITVARAYGFRVRAFVAPVPTPLVAFCTRAQRAVAGIMITASHNPPTDNGIKLYLEGGAQVLAPHDAAIAAAIASFAPGTPLPTSELVSVYETLGEREVEAYLDTIGTLVPSSTSLPLPRFGYSALHGVGTAVTRQLFARVGARNAMEVESQAAPQRDLGGLASPNPEHPSALAALWALATGEQLDLAFAHDPDADRLAVLARTRTGQLRALSGDEVGALLGDFLLAASPAPSRALLLSTLVSGELLERICRAYGARFERTPTGFKWIASRARKLERELPGLSFLFGYEEAIGYAFGQIADDKDGIAALSVLLELARRLHAEGKTLCDALDTLSRRHGVFATRQLTVPRGRGQAEGDLMSRLRAVDPVLLLGPGTTRTDYQQQPEAVELLVFRRANGSRLCVRPSGTEPKLKLYLHAAAEVSTTLEAAEAEAQRELDDLQVHVTAI
jgi:phosphomannomutase